MTQTFEDKMVFPAPDPTYTTESHSYQILYIPRNILQTADRMQTCDYPTITKLTKMHINSSYKEFKHNRKLSIRRSQLKPTTLVNEQIQELKQTIQEEEKNQTIMMGQEQKLEGDSSFELFSSDDCEFETELPFTEQKHLMDLRLKAKAMKDQIK